MKPRKAVPASRDPFALVDDQRTALDLRANRIISASAGTGKTHTLTALYAALLEGRLAPGASLMSEEQWLEQARAGTLQPMRPGQIVAVTFTRKAAAELLLRVRAALERERDRTDLPDGLREHLARCCDELPAAPISTIDSFCARLLRDAGARSPAPAAFAVLEQDEADELLERALVDAASNLLDPEARVRAAAEEREHFARLAAEWGVLNRGGVAAVAKQLLNALRVRGATPDELRTRPASSVEAARETLGAFCSAILALTPGKRSKPSDELLALCRQPLPPDAEALRRRLLRTQDGLYSGSARRAWFRDSGLDDPTAELLVTLHAPFAGALAAYVEEAAERYHRAKRKAGAVDFSDLLLCARDVLAASGGQGEYAVVLIDEYQDTNPLQEEVLRRVAFGAAKPSAAVRMAVVGDRKQSIYRFRGADVSLMEQAEKDAAFALAPLRRTFRSHVKLVALLNEFFRSVWPEGGEGFHYDTNHELEAPPEPKERHEWSGPAGELLVPGGEVPNAERHRWQQARVIARRIRCLVAPPRETGTAGQASSGTDADALPRVKVWDRAGECWRAPRYGDVAILARSVKHIRVPLQMALAQMGIPFRMLGGLSFYTRQEVLDVANLLACAVQPRDDLAVAGLLRSPFVGLSDGGLWRVAGAEPRGNGKLFERVLAAAANAQALGFDGRDRAALAQGSALLRELRDGCGRRTAAELIDRACRRTGFLGVLAMLPQGDVAVAAVRRVIELGRAFEARGVRHLADFVRWLREQSDAEWDDPGRAGQAELEPDQPDADNVVKIGTVHSAKGLEFPIVIVADIGAQAPSNHDAAIYVPAAGVGLRLGCEQQGLGGVADSLLEQAREAERAAGDEERRRLLYVALTRARDYLLLIGETRRKDSGNWRNLVAGFARQKPELLGQAPYDHPQLQAATSDTPPGLLVFGDEKATLKAEAVPKAAPPDTESLTALLSGAPQPLPVALRRRDVRISVTALSAWLACPRRAALEQWRDEATVGKPDSEAEPAEPGDEDAREPDARALGTAAHAVLEAVFGDGAADVRKEWAYAAALAGVADAGEDAQAVVGALEALVRSPWGQMVCKLPANARFVERPFRCTVQADDASGATVTLSGKIDLLAAVAGQWQVFDYKLAAVPDRGSASLLRYTWQALLYAAVSAQILREPCGGALIFLREKTMKPLPIHTLCAAGAIEFCALKALLRFLLESRQQPDPDKLARHVWLPAQAEPTARDRERCAAEGCPFLARCYAS
jgi:ATP-dependent exoDNAse (exonuclease V) beta subunit